MPSIPTVTTAPVTYVSKTGATAHGEVTNTGGATVVARGFDPYATPILQSAEIPIQVGDGTVAYNGYIYMVSRNSGTPYVAKISEADLTFITSNPGFFFFGGDCICETGGYIWIASSGEIVCKLSAVDLSVVEHYSAVTSGDGAYSMCADNDYIYIGGADGSVAKIKISDGTITKNLNQRVGAGEMHSMCQDGSYLYGAINGTPVVIYKINKSDLSFATTITASNISISDDICQDATYFYLPIEAYIDPATAGVIRVQKSDLSYDVYTPTDMVGLDGLTISGDYLIAEAGDYDVTGVVTGTWLWIIDKATMSQYNRIFINLGSNGYWANELIVDGEYVYVTRFGTPTPPNNHNFVNKFKLTDILTNFISATETGSFGAETFNAVISGLSPHTNYHTIAFAKNSVGYNYGTGVDFTTIYTGPFPLFYRQ